MSGSTRRLRLLTAARVGCGLVVASTLVGVGVGAAPGAQAQSAPTPTPTLGGFTGSAAASGMHVRYNPEGLLPTGAPVDLGAPDALATIAGGPSTFARASVADPGDLLANPEALLVPASPDYPAGTVPAYPFRIAASSGVGEPSAESNPAPGLNARVQAEGGTASASSTSPMLSAPPIATIGSMTASATSTTDGTTVTVHSRTEIGTVDVFGVLHIDSIVTDLTATSTGGDTTLDGGTTVSGATVLGQPVTIDDQGIRSAAGGVDPSTVLSPLGISISLPGPVAMDGTVSGRLASNGLRIEIAESGSTAPGLSDLLDLIPPIDPIAPGVPGVEDVIAVARARHVTSVELGHGEVSLTARSPAPRRPTTPATTPDAPSRPATSTGAVPSSPVARPSTTPAAPVAAAPAAPVATAEVPVASVSTGIGALAVLLLLLQPFIGDRLTRAAGAVLASDQEGCPWERR